MALFAPCFGSVSGAIFQFFSVLGDPKVAPNAFWGRFGPFQHLRKKSIFFDLGPHMSPAAFSAWPSTADSRLAKSAKPEVKNRLVSKRAENFGIGVKFYSEDDGAGVNSNKARKLS